MAKKKKEKQSVKIRKLRTNYELRYDFLPILNTFIKTLPREHRSYRVDNVLDVNGGNKDEWVRIIREVQIGNIISFLIDNAIPFVFENLLPEELDTLRKEYLERQRRIASAIKLKESDLSVDDMDFSFMKIQPYDYQKQAVKFFEINQGRAILGDQPGVGKSQNLNALISTENGWIRMGDIKVGQKIFHRDGNTYPVKEVYPQGLKQTYKITFNDGFSTNSSIEHLWMVRDKNRRRKNKDDWTVKTLGEIIELGIFDKVSPSRAKTNRSPSLKWEIPITSPLNFKNKNFLIDPYILGALIGDGCLCGKEISISIPDFQQEIKNIISDRLPFEFKMRKNKNVCPSYSITRNHSVGKNIIKQEIIRLGLNVKSINKFIPIEYFKGDANQRLELLRGLMDSDGSALNNRITFHSHSKQLALDVCELVQSLGGIAKIKYYDRRHQDKNIEWRVNVRLNICPFNLTEKKENWKKPTTNYINRYIKNIEASDVEEHQCILVDSPDHTYITDHYIVTHNTLPPIAYAAKHKLKTLVVCPASLKLNWRKEILNFSNEKAYVYKYNPSKKSGNINHKKEDSLFHIINYESIQSYIKLEYSHKCNGNMIVPGKGSRRCGLEIIDLTKKHKKCPECKNSNSFKSRIKDLVYLQDKGGAYIDPEEYDMIVIDEFHRIKSVKTDWTQIIKRAFRDTLSKKILISGTAIKSRPMEFFSGLNFMDPGMWNSSHDYGVRYCAGFETNFGWDYDGASNLEELFTRISPYFLRRLKRDVLSQLPPKTYTEIEIEMTTKESSEYNKILKEMKTFINKDNEEEKKEEGFLEKIHKLKQFTGRIKLDRMIKDGVLDDISSNGEKLVVMSDYQFIAEELYEKYKDKAVLHTGSMNQEDKQSSVDRFQGDKEISLFSGMIGASGVGITLTEASKLAFLGFGWTPADMEQATDRIHRATTTHDNIQIITYVVVDTIDEIIRDLLNVKENVVSKVLDGKVNKKQVRVADSSILKELINSIGN